MTKEYYSEKYRRNVKKKKEDNNEGKKNKKVKRYETRRK